MKNSITVLFLTACVLINNAVSAAEFQVNTYTLGYQHYPAVGSSGNNYLVTWTSSGQDGSSEGVFGQVVSSDGALVGSEFQINTYTSSYQMCPSVSSTGSDYLVTWYSSSQDNNTGGVYGQVVDLNGSLVGNEFQINTYTTNTQESCSVSSDGNSYLVTWSSAWQDTSDYGVYGQVVSSSGQKVGSEFKINTYTDNIQSEPSIASNGNGYMVTWSSYYQDGIDGSGVYGQVVDSTGALVGDEFQVNTYTTRSQKNSAIASDGTNYLITWESGYQDGDVYGIYGQLVDSAGVSIGEEFQINTYTTSHQQAPTIAFDGENYLVMWESNGQDGSQYGVYGQFINPYGELIGDEFLVNTYTSIDQHYPSVASDGTDFLATWQSWGQDGSYYTVMGDIIPGTHEAEPIPEPATMLLLGLSGLSLLIRRK